MYVCVGDCHPHVDDFHPNSRCCDPNLGDCDHNECFVYMEIINNVWGVLADASPESNPYCSSQSCSYEEHVHHIRHSILIKCV